MREAWWEEGWEGGSEGGGGVRNEGMESEGRMDYGTSFNNLNINEQ